MRLQKFGNKVYLILTNKRENYRMYKVYLQRKGWRISVESYDDRDLVYNSLGGSYVDTLPNTYREVREYHRLGHTWFSSTITVSKEPGLEFHGETKKNGLSRAYEIATL